MEKIYQKIAEVKKEIGKISKSSTNPFFKSKYFDINALLEHTEPILEKHGLMCLQPLAAGNVKTIIIDVESGEQISSEIKLAEYADPQKMGSAITYFRRYTLQSLLALQAEDDDGNVASGKTEKKPAGKTTIAPKTDVWDKAIKYVAEKNDLASVEKNYIIKDKELFLQHVESHKMGLYQSLNQ